MAHRIFNPTIFNKKIFNVHFLFQGIAQTKQKPAPQQVTQTHSVQVLVPLTRTDHHRITVLVPLKQTLVKIFNFSGTRTKNRLKLAILKFMESEL